MNGSVHVEVGLAAAYAVFLAGVAAFLEWVARHTQRRSEQYRVAGFKYHHALDVWECPAGQQLHRQHAHGTPRVARYRAPAHACNACALKCLCTDSHHGREIVRSSFDWLELEVGRFHRGLSLALLLLAQLILGIELLRFRSGLEAGLLGSVLVPLTLLWARWLAQFRASKPVLPT